MPEGGSAEREELEGLTDLERELAELRGELSRARDELEIAEHEREIERLLRDAGVIDVETAMVLARGLRSDGSDTDAATLVAHLRLSKPFLFSSGGGVSLGAMRDADGTGVATLAQRAQRGGDKRSLFEYLRARRGG